MEVVYALILIFVLVGIVRYTGGLGVIIFWLILIICSIGVFTDFTWESVSAWLLLQSILGMALNENRKANASQA